jgi:hypothetical protein
LFSLRELHVYSPECAIYAPSNGFRFLIENGNSIVAEFPGSITDATLHTWLFSTPVAWLCHQRKLTPLHACVVQVGKRAVALAANSGGGKSTTARALIARGHSLLTDDQAVIDPITLDVQPGYPSIKLWSKTAEHAGDAMLLGMRVGDKVDKFHIPLLSAFCHQGAPLGLVVALTHSKNADQPRFEQATPIEAAALLQQFIFRADASRQLDGGQRNFHWTLALSSKVPVVKLIRPDDLSVLDQTCLAIEQFVGFENEPLIL